ncbi:zinc finger protein 35-like [Hyla sarda]|uniref:zinc finger protein 35-like n=1 Tax=Hyla sarda TaxID=327740 RepID=UPI0024C3F871|nr:zinc finger protein 35-like [Hyla sarda]
MSSAVRMDPEVIDQSVSSDDPVVPERTEDCGSSEVDGTSPTSARVSEAAPPAGMEDSTVCGHGGEDTAAGSIHTSESLSVANMAGTTASSSRVRRRKGSPKKREMPDDIEFPLDIIVKEENSDEEYRAAINTDASSGAEGSLGSGILIAQNGTNRPPWAKQKGRRKKRSPAFQKPLLVKSSADTASLMFVIPNEEMQTVVSAKKRRKRKEEEYEEVHWCDICDECFPAEADLEVHMQTHLEPPHEDHDCEDCGRVFDSASELEQHRSKKHGKLRYCCDICGIQYNYESQFVIHMRAHSGERPFSCDDCGQVFGHKCSLVIHQRKHTGVTPHQCKKCKKMLDTRVSLAKHEKMRYCPDCKKCYTHRSFAKHLIKDCAKV